MSLIHNIRYSIQKRFSTYRKTRIWAKYGDQTKYHFDHPDISVGDFTYGIPDVTIYDTGVKLSIGKYCSIAKDVRILLGGEHKIDEVSQYPFQRHRGTFPNAPSDSNINSKNVTIGNDVWIGRGALILSGVTIGDGAIVGAGTVVSKDIPPYSVVVGCPMKIIKYRTSDENIKSLLKIKWWDFPTRVINDLIPYMNNVNNFILMCYDKTGGGIFPD